MSVVVEVDQNVEFQLRHVATPSTKAASSDISAIEVDARIATALSLGSGFTAPVTLGQSVSLSGTLPWAAASRWRGTPSSCA